MRPRARAASTSRRSCRRSGAPRPAHYPRACRVAAGRPAPVGAHIFSLNNDKLAHERAAQTAASKTIGRARRPTRGPKWARRRGARRTPDIRLSGCPAPPASQPTAGQPANGQRPPLGPGRARQAIGKLLMNGCLPLANTGAHWLRELIAGRRQPVAATWRPLPGDRPPSGPDSARRAGDNGALAGRRAARRWRPRPARRGPIVGARGRAARPATQRANLMVRRGRRWRPFGAPAGRRHNNKCRRAGRAQVCRRAGGIPAPSGNNLRSESRTRAGNNVASGLACEQTKGPLAGGPRARGPALIWAAPMRPPANGLCARAAHLCLAPGLYARNTPYGRRPLPAPGRWLAERPRGRATNGSRRRRPFDALISFGASRRRPSRQMDTRVLTRAPGEWRARWGRGQVSGARIGHLARGIRQMPKRIRARPVIDPRARVYHERARDKLHRGAGTRAHGSRRAARAGGAGR